jgi:small GTP-binding protein
MLEERIKQIENEIKNTPYHKGTEHHIAKLRAKLAKLRDQALTPKKSGRGSGLSIKKEGNATIVLFGFPSVGKSTLLNKLTGAASKIGAYDFTTMTVIPGILKLNGAIIQILDLPGIISGAARGKGKGKQILSAARMADLLMIITDVSKPQQEKTIKKELYESGVRINEVRPEVTIKKKNKGGLQILLSSQSSLATDVVKNMAQEFGLANAEIIIKEDLSLERLIDAFSVNRVYLPALFIVNKIDLVKNRKSWQEKFPDHLLISAQENIGLEKLKATIWKKLGLIRVFLKPKGGKIDENAPLILKKNSTVIEAAGKISQELASEIKGAKIYGKKARYQGQTVGTAYPLSDGLVITLIN